MTLKQVKNHFRVFALFYQKAPKFLVGLTVTFIAAATFPLIYNLYVGNIIDRAVTIATNHGQVSEIYPWLFLFILILGIDGVINLYKRYSDLVFNHLLDIFIEVFNYQKKLELDPQTHLDPDFVAKRNLIEWNMWKIAGAPQTIIEIFSKLIPAILYTIILISYNWLIGVLVALSVIPEIISNIRFGKRVWSIWDSSTNDKIVWNTYRNSFWGDITELKLLGAGQYILKKMTDIQYDFTDRLIKNEKNRLSSLLFSTVIEYIFLTFSYLLLFRGIIGGEFTVGSFFVITASLWSVKRQLSEFFEDVTRLESNAKFVDDFILFLDWEPAINTISNPIEINFEKPYEIEFRDVWFKYPHANKWIFKGLNFKITKDEDLAIVGKNGAGKTTLIRLVMRIYDPNRGEILINGIPLSKIDIQKYHSSIGLLNQDFRIYDFSVAENIQIGNSQEELDRELMIKAAKQAHAHKFIEETKKGYSTFLTNDIEGGQELSGGQKQRLAIARIFYRNPNLLILDEPTSAIDALAEEKIFNNIFKFAKDRNVLIVSHRFSTVKKAQRIIVIDKGQIVEDGNHETLMSHNSLYQKMYSAQSTI